MAQKYIYWKWSNGGILKQSLRETNKNAKIQEHSNPIQESSKFIDFSCRNFIIQSVDNFLNE